MDIIAGGRHIKDINMDERLTERTDMNSVEGNSYNRGIISQYPQEE